MNSVDHSRDPWYLINFNIFYSPWRIIEDAGTGFSMGAIGFGIIHAFKGFRNSPRVQQLNSFSLFFARENVYKVASML